MQTSRKLKYRLTDSSFLHTLVLAAFVAAPLMSCSDDNEDGPKNQNDAVPYTLFNGDTKSFSSKAFASEKADESAVKVTDGTLTLTNCEISKTGNTTNPDNSSFYGVNAAVVAAGIPSKITINGGTITSFATGANAAVAYGGTIAITGTTIYCSGQYAHAIHATNEGKITATNLSAATVGPNSSVIATDRGGGTIDVFGGNYSAKGDDAAIIYSTGTIRANGMTGSSLKGEMIVVEGSNSVTLTDCNLESKDSIRGILMLQSGSGDASGVTGNLSVTGGSLFALDTIAPLIEVTTNSTGNVMLDSVKVFTISKVLMKVDQNTRWSTSGATGNLTLSGQVIYDGDIEADNTGTAIVTVNSGTTWYGAFNKANTAKAGSVTLNGGTWKLTGQSNVGTLTLTNGAKIDKNGFTLTVTTLNKISGTISN
ncbi:MAG: hypothetical protein PHI48_10550 [Bacteroidales bacterium]|nr:hypothetical protein [Bacteroidales bacterium]MDD4822980.1 hypothetical protein [Bacteroidales bacterium]